MSSRPNITMLVAALCRPFERLAKAQQQLLTERTIDTAVGAQLDVLRRIVDQPAEDVDEDTMRSLVRARALANRCHGTGDEILKIVRLVLQDYAARADVLAAGTMTIRLVDEGAACYVIRVDGIDLPWDLAVDILTRTFLDEVTGAGIRAILEFIPSDDSLSLHDGSFRFDGDATDGGGWGDAVAGTVGGRLLAAFDTRSS
jgi:hypothetical protein